MNIAIDGPAGAGKSSAARLAAKKLGFLYVDTGALYRAIGVAALRKGIATDDARAVAAMLPALDVALAYADGEQRVLLNGEDVSKEIRLPEVGMAASNVSAIPAVRAFLFDLQRGIAKQNDCIMDGRDIGTVVLPDAACKIFLTAAPEIRAQRRFLELEQKGTPVPYETLLEEIRQRDYNDSHRAVAPLKPAPDAVVLDSSFLTLEEVAARVAALAKECAEGKL